jgi:uncharacterized protein (DUF4415 family)
MATAHEQTTTTGKRSEKSDMDEMESPPLDRRFFATAIALEPGTLMAALGSGPKQQITLRVDQDVIKFFKGTGQGISASHEFRSSVLHVEEAASSQGANLEHSQAQSAEHLNNEGRKSAVNCY